MLALLPSPLLGPAVWHPVVAPLTDLHWNVIEIGSQSSVGADPESFARMYVEALPERQDLILIPHSNAGLLAPLISAHRTVVGNVFVDASLPPASGGNSVISPDVRMQLAEMADEVGLLPPWTSWWPPSEADALFPSATVRAQVEQEQTRLPLSYFDHAPPVPTGWASKPASYLAFGDTYAAQRAEAASRGWAGATMSGNHLHMLVDPSGVAAEIDRLVREMGFPP